MKTQKQNVIVNSMLLNILTGKSGLDLREAKLKVQTAAIIMKSAQIELAAIKSGLAVDCPYLGVKQIEAEKVAEKKRLKKSELPALKALDK